MVETVKINKDERISSLVNDATRTFRNYAFKNDIEGDLYLLTNDRFLKQKYLSGELALECSPIERYTLLNNSTKVIKKALKNKKSIGIIPLTKGIEDILDKLQVPHERSFASPINLNQVFVFYKSETLKH